MGIKGLLIKVCLPLLLISICLWSMFLSYGYGSANLGFYRVKNILEVWQTQGERQSLGQYQLAKDIMQNVLIKHPDNALYIATMAEIYEWGAMAEYEDRHAALKMANRYYQKSLKLRPSWPVTWASLAMVKWRQQEFDDELLYFLKQASHYGPLKTEVHIVYAQLGLALYQSNHPLLLKFSDDFYRHLALGLRNPKSRNLVREEINQKNLHKQVCRWLRNETERTLMMIKGCVNNNLKS